jgi:hypothetical protein
VLFPAGSSGRRSAGPPSNRPAHIIETTLGAGSVWNGYHMISLDAYRQQWFGNIKADLLSGLVVALALIPEAIAFSMIAGGHL